MKRKDIKENPELRFSEFRTNYTDKSFQKLLTLKTRSIKMKDESIYQLVTVKRRYGGVVSRGFFKGKKILVKSQFVLQTMDFLISKRQISHKACGLVPDYLEGAIVSNEYSVFVPQAELDIVYFNYFCCLPIVSHTFFLSSIGVHIEKMLFKVDDWLKWEFPFPTFPEQQKIASFLSVIDKKIEQLTRKKELLEQYKKGVMQKIFSQEKRFKDEDGQDYPDWEGKRLGEVGKFMGGGTPSTKKKYYWGGNTPWISSSNLSEETIYDVVPTKFITNDAINNSATKLIPPNSILIVSRVGVGKVALNTFELCTSQDFTTLVEFTENPVFLAYAIKKQINRLLSFNQGTSIKGIVKNDLKKLSITNPCMEEQHKIANLLTSIDNKITVTQMQLSQTKTYKNGLLQKMFV